MPGETGYSSAAYSGGAGAAAGTGNVITQDPVNLRVGINQTAPANRLDLHAPSGSAVVDLDADVDNTTNQSGILMRVANAALGVLSVQGANNTPSGAIKALGAVLNALGAGGLSLVASNAAGIIRTYVGGSADAANYVDLVKRGLQVRGLTTTVAGGPVTTMTLSGLLGDTDLVYRIKARLINATANDTWAYFRPNGATTNLNGSHLQNGNHVANTDGQICTMRPNSTVDIELVLYCTGTDRRWYARSWCRNVTTHVLTSVISFGTWNTSSPEITTVEIVSAGAAELANGSNISAVVAGGLF